MTNKYFRMYNINTLQHLCSKQKPTELFQMTFCLSLVWLLSTAGIHRSAATTLVSQQHCIWQRCQTPLSSHSNTDTCKHLSRSPKWNGSSSAAWNVLSCTKTWKVTKSILCKIKHPYKSFIQLDQILLRKTDHYIHLHHFTARQKRSCVAVKHK